MKNVMICKNNNLKPFLLLILLYSIEINWKYIFFYKTFDKEEASGTTTSTCGKIREGEESADAAVFKKKVLKK
jgi:hypothetical protein